MKNLIFKPYGKLGALFCLIVTLVASCGPDPDPVTPECKSTQSVEQTSIVGTDRQTGSPYSNKLILQFYLDQNVDTYNNNCKPKSYNTTSLKIKNLTTSTIHFGFLLRVTVGVVKWEHQDVADIPAGGTKDFGEINQNEQRIKAGFVEYFPIGPITYD